MVAAQEIISLRIKVHGLVQGVGFRPFLHRLAKKFELAGKAFNTPYGLQIEIEGDAAGIERFCKSIERQAPGQSKISSIETEPISSIGQREFKIVASSIGVSGRTMMPLDQGICPACKAEMLDPDNRRYRYPFINCTDCGPRYTIIRTLPYDRPNTSMVDFEMCDECRKEYENIEDRRYHAQPIACPKCGPTVSLLDNQGNDIGKADEAMDLALDALKAGHIVAIKGLGGFHLACDAKSEKAVRRLRDRKARPDKPLAVMVRDLDTAKKIAFIDHDEQSVLTSPQAPIVLCRTRGDSPLAPSVSKASNLTGLMLPYTPLHLLLFTESIDALVMTSGNRAGSPTIICEKEAPKQLSSIADFFLVHNRPILHRADDSVVRFIAGRSVIYRAARAYAPITLELPIKGKSVLAVGGDLKNAFCLAAGSQAMVSTYLGDLEIPEVQDQFHNELDHLRKLYKIDPKKCVCDQHPDYAGTRMAVSMGDLESIKIVQHHHAHALSVLTDNNTLDPAVAIILDGAGYGDDGTIWGGEILFVDGLSYKRVGHLKPIPMIGGDKATSEVWRLALGLLHDTYGDNTEAVLSSIPSFKQLSKNRTTAILNAAQNRIGVISTTSAGRMFDAVSSLLNICQNTTYEGQAAIELEAVASKIDSDESYSFTIEEKNNPFQIDFSKCTEKIVEEIQNHTPASIIARKFHNTMVLAMAKSALLACKKFHTKKIALSGGVIQNKIIVEGLVDHLSNHGFEVLTHKAVPPNDGGLGVGQAVAGILS